MLRRVRVRKICARKCFLGVWGSVQNISSWRNRVKIKTITLLCLRKVFFCCKKQFIMNSFIGQVHDARTKVWLHRVRRIILTNTDWSGWLLFLIIIIYSISFLHFKYTRRKKLYGSKNKFIYVFKICIRAVMAEKQLSKKKKKVYRWIIQWSKCRNQWRPVYYEETEPSQDQRFWLNQVVLSSGQSPSWAQQRP